MTCLLRMSSVVSRTLAHVRIPIVGRRGEQFLDGARIDPARQVEQRTGLVVGAAGSRPAEGLLTDYRSGGLVIDVEIACRESQRVGGSGDRGAVRRDDRAGQCV